MITPDTLKALRVIALRHADEKTYDAWYKSIARWYSREFHTALSLVMEMADEDVLRVYFEDTFWRLKTGDDKGEEAFERIVQDVLVDGHHESQVEMEEVDAEDDDWYEQELAELEEKLSKQDSKITRETVVSSMTGGLMDKPNLDQEPTTRFVEGDDDPFPDDEGL